MDIKDFVKETLVEISMGVSEAQKAVNKLGGCVNPTDCHDPARNIGIAVSKTADNTYFGVSSQKNVFLISFDIAVSVTEETGTGAKAKLNVVNLLNLGISGESGNINSVVNRVSFKIPLALP